MPCDAIPPHIDPTNDERHPSAERRAPEREKEEKSQSEQKSTRHNNSHLGPSPLSLKCAVLGESAEFLLRHKRFHISFAVRRGNYYSQFSHVYFSYLI